MNPNQPKPSLTHRAAPFSGKMKRQQMVEKRKKKAQRDDDGDDDGDEADANHATATSSTTTAGASASSRSAPSAPPPSIPAPSNIIAPFVDQQQKKRVTHFKEDSADEIALRKKLAYEKVTPVDAASFVLPMAVNACTSMPKRPAWTYQMSQAEIDARETKEFEAWVAAMDADPNVNHFEHNLEVWRQLWRCLEISDVVMIVIDVRFVPVYFPQALYDHVTQDLHKPVILVLNKVDLASRSLVLEWAVYFRTRFPAVKLAFFTSTPADVTVCNNRLVHADDFFESKRTKRRRRWSDSFGVAELLQQGFFCHVCALPSVAPAKSKQNQALSFDSTQAVLKSLNTTVEESLDDLARQRAKRWCHSCLVFDCKVGGGLLMITAGIRCIRACRAGTTRVARRPRRWPKRRRRRPSPMRGGWTTSLAAGVAARRVRGRRAGRSLARRSIAKRKCWLSSSNRSNRNNTVLGMAMMMMMTTMKEKMMMKEMTTTEKMMMMN